MCDEADLCWGAGELLQTAGWSHSCAYNKVKSGFCWMRETYNSNRCLFLEVQIENICKLQGAFYCNSRRAFSKKLPDSRKSDSNYKFKNTVLCIKDAWKVTFVKDWEQCVSAWLRPSNVEFVGMRLFLICCSRSNPGSICVCVPTFSHLQKYSLCRLLSHFPQGTRLSAFPSSSGTNLALGPHKLMLLWKPARRNHIAVTNELVQATINCTCASETLLAHKLGQAIWSPTGKLQRVVTALVCTWIT